MSPKKWLLIAIAIGLVFTLSKKGVISFDDLSSWRRHLPFPEQSPTPAWDPNQSAEQQARDAVFAYVGGETSYREQDKPSAQALEAAHQALERHGVPLDSIETLAVADFTKPSYLRRLALYRQPGALLASRSPISQHLCSHGSGSGKLYCETPSNVPGSHQTSLGLYRIGDFYSGQHGDSVRLLGLEPGVNDLAQDRAIVLHPAWYCSYRAIATNIQEENLPRLGCSQGCPAVPLQESPAILDALQGVSYLYIHGYGGEARTFSTAKH